MSNPTIINDEKIQKVLGVDAEGNPSTSGSITSVNGKISGSLFGDDFVTTTRKSTLAAKWSQGLPNGTIDKTISHDGRWFVIEDENDNTLFDGTSCIESGVNPESLTFLSTKKLNRYLAGHVSYFGYTAAFDYSEQNGNFEILIGAMQRGSISSGRFDEIKDGACWGVVRDNTSLRS